MDDYMGAWQVYCSDDDDVNVHDDAADDDDDDDDDGGFQFWLSCSDDVPRFSFR